MTAWTNLVKETYTAGKKGNPNYKLKHAMKDAAKTYKAQKKGGNPETASTVEEEKPIEGGSTLYPTPIAGGKKKSKKHHKKHHTKKTKKHHSKHH